MPEISVTGKGVLIEDEDWWPSAKDDTYFGTVSPGRLVTRTFKVWNTGSATLALETPVLPIGWAFQSGTDTLVSSLAPGAWDTFSVNFSASELGAYRGNISIGNNDSDENPYVFAIMAIVGVPEIDVSGKGFSIADGDTTPSTLDGTNFGTVPPNTIASRTFTVTNIGEDTLWLGTTPSLPAGFRLGADRLVASLAPGTSDTFVVEFLSVTAGTFGGDVVIYNNDSNESPYNFTIMAIAGSPEINVSGKGLTIVDGDTTPSTADDTNFGTVPLNTMVSHTFTVANTGSDTLWLGTTPSLPAGFRLGSDRLVASLAPGTSDTFVVEFPSVTAGTYGGDVVIYNSDANESPYNFRIMAISGSPEIDVMGNGLSIVDGDTTPRTADGTDFGTVQFKTNVLRTFTVKNTGSDTLSLGTPSVVGSGFRRGPKVLKSSLAPGESDTFTVVFTSTSTGTKTGEVTLYNSDANESPYNFSLTATALAPEISITGKESREIACGSTPPNLLDGTDFGVALLHTLVSQTFTITNLGTAVLTLGTLSITGQGFGSIGAGYPSSLGPGNSADFTVTFLSSIAGPSPGQIELSDNDADEAPYRFTVMANAGDPDIEVSGKGKVIVNPDPTPEIPDDTDFGSMMFNAPGVTHIFTVTNTGTTTLKPTIRVIPPGFKLGANGLAASIEPTMSDTFEITLESSTTLGLKTGTVIIDSNDPDESPFKFDIKGIIKGYEISGTIKYDTINPKPVRGALVKAWNQDFPPDTFLGEAYTDDNGRYKIITTNEADDIWLKVYARTAPFGLGAGNVMRGVWVTAGNESNEASSIPYSHDFYPTPGLTIGPSTPNLSNVDTTIDDVTLADQSFWAFDAAITASRFHATLPGIEAGRYTVMFPNPFDDLPGDQTSAAYNGQIFLDPEDWNNWDVIIHEYGHLVAGDAGFFNITGNPFYWSHSTGENARVSHPGMDYDDMMQLGFNEGWANFYSMVCQTIQGVSTPPVGSAGQPFFGPHSVENPTAMHGEDEELSAMAIFWDLYDSYNASESADTISMGIGPLCSLLGSVNTATGTKPATLNDLWDMLMTSAPDLATKLAYGRIFELNHVSPELKGASTAASTSPATAVTLTTADGPPTLHWTIPLASNNTQLLNQFGILIFDNTNALVYDSGSRVIGTASGTVQLTGNLAAFTPAATDWTTYITSRVSGSPKTFRWVVYGEFAGDNFTSTILTGQYWSSNGEIIVTP